MDKCHPCFSAFVLVLSCAQAVLKKRQDSAINTVFVVFILVGNFKYLSLKKFIGEICLHIHILNISIDLYYRGISGNVKPFS